LAPLFLSAAKFATQPEGEMIDHLDEVTMKTDFRTAKFGVISGILKGMRGCSQQS